MEFVWLASGPSYPQVSTGNPCGTLERKMLYELLLLFSYLVIWEGLWLNYTSESRTLSISVLLHASQYLHMSDITDIIGSFKWIYCHHDKKNTDQCHITKQVVTRFSGDDTSSFLSYQWQACTAISCIEHMKGWTHGVAQLMMVSIANVDLLNKLPVANQWVMLLPCQDMEWYVRFGWICPRVTLSLQLRFDQRWHILVLHLIQGHRQVEFQPRVSIQIYCSAFYQMHSIVSVMLAASFVYPKPGFAQHVWMAINKDYLAR